MRHLVGSSAAVARSHRLARVFAGALGGLGAMLSNSWRSNPYSRELAAAMGDIGDASPSRPLPPGEKTFFLIASVALVLLAGLMSGLTLGLMSLDVVDLQVILRSGSEREKRYARKIAPVVKHPHFLLVTLVFCNAFATETLPIFLDRLTSPLAAVALSMSVVLLFGEVIPQAVCSRYGLAVGAQAAWLVRILMVVCFPVAAPLAAVLDRALGGGDHAGAGGASSRPSALFRRAQLKALVDVHAADEGLGGNLTVDEVAVIRGALDLSAKTAACCLTPIERVFALPTDARLDRETMRAIVASGHSRVPVHSPGDKEAIVGVILVKELLLVDRDFGEEEEEEEREEERGEQQDERGGEATEGWRRESRRPRLLRGRAPPLVAELKLRTLPHLRSDTKLYDMLRLFETGRCHMAVLVTPPRPLGAVDEGSDGGGGGGSDGDFDDDDGEEEERRPRVPTRDFSDDASDGAAVAAPPSPSLSRHSSALIPVPSFPSNQNGSALAEVLCARGDRLTPPAASTTTAATATARANCGSGGTGEIEPAATAAAPDRPPSPTSSFSSSSSVEDTLGGRVLGIVTIEDVLEELIGHAILDETDRFEDRHGKCRVNARALAASLPSHLRELLRDHSIRVGGGGGAVGERVSVPGYGVGMHFHGHGHGVSGSGVGVGVGGSRLLPPAARQAVIGNIAGVLLPHGNTAQAGSASSPLAAAVAARRSRSSIEAGGSPASLLRQPLLSASAGTTATATSTAAAPASSSSPPAAKRPWT